MSIRTPLTGANKAAVVDSVPANVDPTGRFSIRADLYRLYRPTYPGEAILPMLMAECALGDAMASSNNPVTVADIGSGTGISSRLFLTSASISKSLSEAGKSMLLYGVEPNEPMRKGAEDDLREFEQTEGDPAEAGKVFWNSVDGSAETTNLPDNSIDMLVAFQAGHWFKTAPTVDEFRRILRTSDKPNL
jgi:hypothetical protein